MITPFNSKNHDRDISWGRWNVAKAKAVGRFTQPSIINQLFDFHGKSLLLALPYVTNWYNVKRIVNIVWDNTNYHNKHEIEKIQSKIDALDRQYWDEVDYIEYNYEEDHDEDKLMNIKYEIALLKRELKELNRYYGTSYRHLVKSPAMPRYRAVASMFYDYDGPWNDYPETIDEVLDFLDQFTESKHGMEFAKTVALLLGITIH
jgi:hypothetical protein